MDRAMKLEQLRPNSSGVILQDAEVACILDMIKEKLYAQTLAGLLDETRLGAVRFALKQLDRLSRLATSKRPLVPPKLAPPDDNRSKVKRMIGDLIAKILTQKGMASISDYDLRILLFKVLQDTELEGCVDMPKGPPPVEVCNERIKLVKRITVRQSTFFT
jgi:hypothetical protein